MHFQVCPENKRKIKIATLFPGSFTVLQFQRVLCCNLQLKSLAIFSSHKFVAGKRIMISILAQERLLGATLGVLFTGAVVFEERRQIYSSISNIQSQSFPPFPVREPIFGKKTRSELAHLWNKTVDQTFGPLIKSLSSRGW